MPSRLGLAAACLLALCATEAAAEFTHCFVYTGGVMTSLGTLGGLNCRTFDMNEAGQIVGRSDPTPGSDSHAFVYGSGVMTDLGTFPGGGDSTAVAINESGEVAGYATTAGGGVHAFLHSGGSLTDLGTLGGTGSVAYAINEAGQIVGLSMIANGNQHAFLYDGGVMTDLGTLGGDHSYVTTINDAGQVIGSSYTAGGRLHAFLSQGGVMTELGVLGGSDSFAYAINAGGQIVGESDTAGGYRHAFLYDSGVMTDLGTLGGNSSTAVAINTAGQVLGVADTAGGGRHAFLYDGGVMTDLGNYYAMKLNDAGQIVLGAPDGHLFLYDGGTMTALGLLGGATFSTADALNSSGTVAGTLFGYFCPAAPIAGCRTAPKSSLRLRNADDDAMDRFRWTWSSGEAVSALDLEFKEAALLCLYDTSAGTPALATKLATPAYGGWSYHSDTNLFYDNGSGNDDGVYRIRLKTGGDGRPAAQLSAKGVKIPMPAAYSSERMFHQDTSVTVQLHQNVSNICWTSEFATAVRNDPSIFKASQP